MQTQERIQGQEALRLCGGKHKTHTHSQVNVVNVDECVVQVVWSILLLYSCLNSHARYFVAVVLSGSVANRLFWSFVISAC